MEKYLILFLVSSVTLALASHSFAATTTLNGEQLLSNCQAAVDILDNNFGRVQIEGEYVLGSKAGICQGYLMSVSELNPPGNLKHPNAYCLPVNYTLVRGAAVVVKYLENHPQQQTLQATTLVARAFSRYFPCQRAALSSR